MSFTDYVDYYKKEGQEDREFLLKEIADTFLYFKKVAATDIAAGVLTEIYYKITEEVHE